MTSGNHDGGPARPNGAGAPPTDKRKMALAGALLAIPVIALMWVPSYARKEPELAGFPFFYWYQFVWVFLTSALTWTAYKLTLAARPTRPPAPERRHGAGSGDGGAAL